MKEYILVLITCPNQNQALKIKEVLLKKRLAACINLIEKVDSFFWWQGKIDAAQEVLLLIKTSKDLFDELCIEVKRIHGYSVPEIIAIPITKGNKEYLEWLKENLK